MSTDGGSRLPPSGLADELIPLLRSRLGIRDEARPADLLDVAADVEQLSVTDATDAAPASARFVAFDLGDTRYGLAIESVLEIVRVGAITRVPRCPPDVRGVMNVRGRLLLVVDTSVRFGGSSAAVSKDSRVVIVEIGDRRLGLLVDRVTHLASLAESEIDPPPPEVVNADVDCFSGVGRDDGRMLFLVDVQRLARSGGPQP